MSFYGIHIGTDITSPIGNCVANNTVEILHSVQLLAEIWEPTSGQQTKTSEGFFFTVFLQNDSLVGGWFPNPIEKYDRPKW